MIFNNIGIDGQPINKTIWGTTYITFVYYAPKFISYIALSVHLMNAYFHFRFIKPEGAAGSNIGYPIQLVWRQRPLYKNGRLYTRYCFEYKYEDRDFKKL